MRWSEAQLAAYQDLTGGGHLPTRARRKPPQTPGGLSEHQIHSAVAAHLRARCPAQVVWWHTPNGELRDPVTAAKLKRMGVRAGLPDFLLLITGRLYGLELKRERGAAISPAQREMHAALISAGAIVATARGLDEVLEILTAWGAFKPANDR